MGSRKSPGVTGERQAAGSQMGSILEVPKIVFTGRRLHSKSILHTPQTLILLSKVSFLGDMACMLGEESTCGQGFGIRDGGRGFRTLGFGALGFELLGLGLWDPSFPGLL